MPPLVRPALDLPLQSQIRAPRPPNPAGPPDYNWAIGVIGHVKGPVEPRTSGRRAAPMG